jgi:hypothetical protein
MEHPVTRRRRPGAFAGRSNGIDGDAEHDCLTLEEYRAARGLDSGPAPALDERQADDEPAMTDRQRLVRLARDVADDLDDRGRPGHAGLLRQLARAVLEPGGPDRCQCGRPIAQPATGRHRRWCTTCRPPRNARETAP